MTPIREPEPLLAPLLTIRQCRAVQRALAWTLKESPEAEADHTLLVTSLGEVSRTIKDEEDRLAVEANMKLLGEL